MLARCWARVLGEEKQSIHGTVLPDPKKNKIKEEYQKFRKTRVSISYSKFCYLIARPPRQEHTVLAQGPLEILGFLWFSLGLLGFPLVAWFS